MEQIKSISNGDIHWLSEGGWIEKLGDHFLVSGSFGNIFCYVRLTMDLTGIQLGTYSCALSKRE